MIDAEEECEAGTDDDTNTFLSAVKGELGLCFVSTGNLKSTAIIEGNEYPVVIDTGAARSMCSADVAAKLGLRLTGEQRSFRGIGVVVGERTAAVQCTLQGFAATIEFWVVQLSNFPIIIGRLDLVRMGAIIDPSTGILCSRGKDTLTAENDADGDCVDGAHPNVVSSVDERKTDEELTKDYHSLFTSLTTHLKDTMRDRLWRILLAFRACWLRPRTGKLLESCASFEVHGKPVKLHLRPLAPELSDVLDIHIDNMLEMKVIRPSKSPWAAAPVFCRKKTGEWRMCIDYRKLNEQMVADAYPLPLVWENLQLAAGHKYYICLDCSWGFWNIPLEEESKKYTAFISHRGMFEYNVLPFGIRNAPAAMQRAVDQLLGDLRHRGVLCYIDDIIIYSNDIDEQFALFEEVLRRCTEAGLFLKFKKSEFLKSSVRLLGHIIGQDGIMPGADKVAAIRNSIAPRNRKELRSFLGLASYVRRFVPNFATIAEPLTRLTSARTKWEWREEQQEAFHSLVDTVCEHVLLNSPRKNDGFVIATDASDVGVGAALMQYVDGDLEVLEFASKKLDSAQRNWSTTEREAFGIRWAVSKFEDYVKAGKIYLLTDHDALRCMASATGGKILRWSLYLQQFDLRIGHIKGEDNVIADWLSRCGGGDGDLDDSEIDLMAVPIFTTEERAGTHHALVPALPSREDFIRGLGQIQPEEVRLYLKNEDGLYYHPRTGALFVPSALRESLMYWFHLSRYGAHAGVNRMLRRMRPLLSWEGMSQDVRRYVSACLPCQRLQSRPPRSVYGFLSKPLPFQLISVDFVGPLETGPTREKRHFLVIIDHATRFLQADFVWDPTAVEAVRILKTRWVAVFGAPTAVLSDRGSVFVSGAFQDYVVEELKSFHVFTSPYYPQGNAVNESSHRSLKKALTLSQRLDYYSLEDCLQDAAMVHNSCPHPGLGCSPYFALFGMELCFPGWQEFMRSPGQEDRLNAIREFRARALVRCMLRERHAVDAEGGLFAEGDWVLYWLGSYERTRDGAAHSGFSDTNWSLPAKVVAVKDTTILVNPLGRPGNSRQVPKTQARKLVTSIPPSLVSMNIRELEMSRPRNQTSKQLLIGYKPPETTWDDVTRLVGEQETTSPHAGVRRKRAKALLAQPLSLNPEDVEEDKACTQHLTSS